MAINLDERYPGRANPKTLSYPQGSFKNRTSPTSKDGTYLEQDWANDWAGFFQRMMVVSGISPNGAVDTAESSQYFDALAKIISDATPDASTTKKGLVELATAAEAQAMTDDTRAITPKKLGAVLDDVLGTAATRDVTTSATDTTPGRVPTVGWMGLGAQYAPSTTEANKDDPRPAGFYGAGTNTITPFPTTANILHLAGYGNYQAQIAVGLSTGSTPRMFLRNYDDGTWRGPVEIYHSGNFNPGTAATRDVGTSSGTVAAGDDPRITGAAQKSANLSDLTNAATARNNLGLGNNATGRSNLGLGNSATRDVGTASGTVAAGDDSRIIGAAQKSANLGDLANPSTARTNLGLGTAATRDVGTSSGNVMEVGAFGLGTIHPPSLSLTYDSPSRFFNASGDAVPNEWGQGGGVNNEHTGGVLIQRDYRPLALFFGNRLELKLSRHNGTSWQPAVTVHHTGNILKTTGNNDDFPMSQKAVSDQLLGVGQTWQNVASSRAPGTTYTNTTGRTIMVYIAFDPDGTSSTITLGSVQMPFSVDTTREYASFIVPPGLTYRLSAAGTNSPLAWLELR